MKPAPASGFSTVGLPLMVDMGAPLFYRALLHASPHRGRSWCCGAQHTTRAEACACALRKLAALDRRVYA
jgi:hypothetical protein